MVLPKRGFLIHNEIIPLKQNVQASFSNFDTHKSHDIFALIGKTFSCYAPAHWCGICSFKKSPYNPTEGIGNSWVRRGSRSPKS